MGDARREHEHDVDDLVKHGLRRQRLHTQGADQQGQYAEEPGLAGIGPGNRQPELPHGLDRRRRKAQVRQLEITGQAPMGQYHREEHQERQQEHHGAGDRHPRQPVGRDAELAEHQHVVERRREEDRHQGDRQQRPGEFQAHGKVAQRLKPQARQQAGSNDQQEIHGIGYHAGILAQPGQRLAQPQQHCHKHQAADGRPEQPRHQQRPHLGFIAPGIGLGHQVADAGDQPGAGGAQLVEQRDGQATGCQLLGTQHAEHHDVDGGQGHVGQVGQDQG